MKLLCNITNTVAECLCEGLIFVVTGDVHHYANRNELKAYIESQGGKVTGSVSKSTNYLINNDDCKSSKIQPMPPTFQFFSRKRSLLHDL